MIAILGTLFGAGLVLGMWSEENQKRSPRAVDGTARCLRLWGCCALRSSSCRVC